MPTAQLKFLNAARINGIMQGLQDPRLIEPELVWTKRIPSVDSTDEEITARYIGQILIADLVADDARANVYSQGKFQFESTKVPNIKMGISMNQAMLNMIGRLQAHPIPDDQVQFQNWENRAVSAVKAGVDQRKEALNVSMLCDGLSYDRFGIKMDNVTWGMPSDLKLTPGIAWDNVNATPITDIQTARRIARVRYGINFNRVTLSSSALQYAVATTEFLNQVKLFGWGMFSGIPAPAVPLQNDSMLRGLLEKVLSGTDDEPLKIETYDARYWTQSAAGLVTSQPFMPITKVILTDSRNDGNPMAMDFANVVVTETIVNSLTDAGINGQFTGPSRGPVAYSSGTHNPASITYWGAARGFPRKHLLQASAVLSVGTFSDTIAVGVPFPA